MEITKESLEQFRIDFKKAVTELEKANNVTIDLKSISYGGTSFTSKVEINLNPKNGMSLEQSKFNELCKLFGFKESDYKKEAKVGGELCQLVGFKPRASKNKAQIILKSNGNGYVCALHNFR